MKFFNHHIWRCSFVSIILVLFALSATSLPASASGPRGHSHTSSATPKPPCSGTSCYNKDPYSTRCGYNTSYNTVSVKSDQIYGGISSLPPIFVYNYYSTWCNANWGAFRNSNPTQLAPGHVWTSTTDSRGVFDLVCEPTNCDNYYNGSSLAWSNMVDGTNTVDVLVESDPSSGLAQYQRVLSQ